MTTCVKKLFLRLSPRLLTKFEPVIRSSLCNDNVVQLSIKKNLEGVEMSNLLPEYILLNYKIIHGYFATKSGSNFSALERGCFTCIPVPRKAVRSLARHELLFLLLF